MDNKQPMLVVVVSAVLLIAAVVWLFVINFNGEGEKQDAVTQTGTQTEGIDLTNETERSFETFELDDFEADFSELDQLQQDIDDINVEEDIIPTL